MRLSTIAGVATFALSAAAFAQVTRNPVEQKNAPANAMAPGNGAASTEDPMGNRVVGNDMPMSPDAKTEPATPRR